MRLFSIFCQLAIFLLVCPLALAEVESVPPIVAAAMNAEQKAIILDVRNDDEWNDRHINGAIHIPLDKLNARLPDIESYKTTNIITQCQTGVRSREAQAILKSAGFTRVYNMEGGLEAWDNEGFKTDHYGR